MKKIGILTYHSVYNYGANLQSLSTLFYFKNRGYIAKIIDWRPRDLFEQYKKITSEEQAKVHEFFFREYYDLTSVCYTDEDIIRIVDKEGFDAIVIGSDAVCRHFPTLIRWRPSRTHLFFKNGLFTPDIFPNPFWGSFYKKLNNRIPMILMSVSSQGTLYQYTLFRERKQLSRAINDFSLITVRDSWTQRVFNYFSYGKILPEITPDPVFGFNANVPTDFISRKVIERFNLPESYIILSFKKKFSPSIEWIKRFVDCCHKKKIAVISLPYPQEENVMDVDINISLPIDPLEWYAIIKYSNGYIGNNMHPIVVSMHNAIPFISFDYYAACSRVSGNVNLEFSKIYDLLSKVNCLDYYYNVQYRKYQFPTPEVVFDKISNYDKRQGERIAELKLKSYLVMMAKIEEVVNKKNN